MSLITTEQLQPIADAALAAEDFPARDHIHKLVPFFERDLDDGEPTIMVYVVTDDTLGGKPFRYPTTVRIGQMLQEAYQAAGYDEFVSCLFKPLWSFEKQQAGWNPDEEWDETGGWGANGRTR